MALELVSIHIPKTAGTSLLHAYYDIYGEENVVHLLRKDVKGNAKQLSQFIKPNTKVLHGHFFYSEIDNSIVENEAVKFVTFLRNPIDRVVSNYHHFIKTAKKNFPGSIGWFRQFESLLKFASKAETQNVLCKYLAPFEWDRFEYFGVQEKYDSELKRLSYILKWDHTPQFELNVHSKKNKLSQNQKNIIEKWNNEDLKLYKELTNMNLRNLIK